MPSPVFFRSGCSNRAPFLAAVRAGVPAGISLAEASARVVAEAGLYLERGGKVFVDSGAFGAFRRGRRLGRADFERILGVYRRLALVAAPDCLFVVSPDVVGDQDATLALIAEYAPALRELASGNARVLVPLQKGALPISEMHREVTRLLGGAPWTPALPSNAAALLPGEVKEFLFKVKPESAHFLGAARSRGFRELLAEVRDLLPRTQYTYDAAVLRSLIGKLTRTEDGLRELACGLMDSGELDDGEFSEALRSADPEALAVAAEALAAPGRSAAEVLAALNACLDAAGGDGLDALERVQPGLDAFWPYMKARWARHLARKEWRTLKLAEQPAFASDPEDLPAPGYLFPCFAA